jgi:alkylhydroperoxidase family enzyme
MELDPRLRELAILRVAAVTRTPYEWHHHEPMGRQAGLDAALVEAVAFVGGPGADAPGGLDGVNRLVVRLVDETIGAGTPSAATVAELEQEIGATQLVELVCTVGYYGMIGQLVRALDVDVDDSPAGDGQDGH